MECAINDKKFLQCFEVILQLSSAQTIPACNRMIGGSVSDYLEGLSYIRNRMFYSKHMSCVDRYKFTDCILLTDFECKIVYFFNLSFAYQI